MGLPTVSVVIAVYNGDRHLRAAVDSILSQTFEDFELLIIDDGSTDRTPQILREVALLDARVKPHRQEHAGVVTAFNLGAALARAEYLAWLGADDVALAGRLELQVRF